MSVGFDPRDNTPDVGVSSDRYDEIVTGFSAILRAMVAVRNAGVRFVLNPRDACRGVRGTRRG